MKNKGFTLIELLVVIVLVGIVMGFAIPSVSKILNTRSQDSYDVHMSLVKEATKVYATKQRAYLLASTATCFQLNYQTLQNSENIIEKDIQCSGNIILRKTATNGFNYEYYLDCKDKKNHYFSQEASHTPAGCTIYP